MDQSCFIRGQILHFIDAPEIPMHEYSYEWIEDGLLEIKEGRVRCVGAWNQNKSKVPTGAHVDHYPHGLILPGFVDCHIHYPQLDMIAAPGGDLFNWLENFTFPFETRFKDPVYATQTAKFFVNELLKNGTTTAMVFATAYPHSVDALFEAAQAKQMKLITGLMVADRNLPEALRQTPDQAYHQSKQLIKKWHKKSGSRLLYALSPRFVPTTSELLFEKLGLLKKEFPDVHVHSHISETKKEVAWVKQLTGRAHYLDTYEQHGLLGPGTLLAHGVHLHESELSTMGENHTGLAFCPTSNFFLGSGLLNLSLAEKHHVRVGLGTDVGAGTSFSQLQTLNEAYKALKLQDQTLSALKGLYLATLGGAKALGLEHSIGNFMPGKEADLTVLNLAGSTALTQRRMSYAQGLEQKLFVLMMLGDDRAIEATYVSGRLSYTNDSKLVSTNANRLGHNLTA